MLIQRGFNDKGEFYSAAQEEEKNESEEEQSLFDVVVQDLSQPGDNEG